MYMYDDNLLARFWLNQVFMGILTEFNYHLIYQARKSDMILGGG